MASCVPRQFELYFQVLALSKTVYFAFFFSGDAIFDPLSWFLSTRQVLVVKKMNHGLRSSTASESSSLASEKQALETETLVAAPA